MKELCMFSLRLWFACRSFSPVISHVRTPACTYFAVLGRFPTPFQVGGSIWLRRFDTVEVWGSSPHGPTILQRCVSSTFCKVNPLADSMLVRPTILIGDCLNISVGTRHQLGAADFCGFFCRFTNISLDSGEFRTQTSAVPVSHGCQAQGLRAPVPQRRKFHPRGSSCSLRTNAFAFHFCARKTFERFGGCCVSHFSRRHSAWRPPSLLARRYPDKTSTWFPAPTGPMEILSCNGKTSLASRCRREILRTFWAAQTTTAPWIFRDYSELTSAGTPGSDSSSPSMPAGDGKVRCCRDSHWTDRAKDWLLPSMAFKRPRIRPCARVQTDSSTTRASLTIAAPNR